VHDRSYTFSRKRWRSYPFRLLCGHCSRPFFCDHKVVSQLNGVNGEFTNSDDRAPSAPQPLNQPTPTPLPTTIIDIEIIYSQLGPQFQNIRVVIVVIQGRRHYYDLELASQLAFTLLAVGLGGETEGAVAFLNGINGEATNSDDVETVIFDTRTSNHAAARVAQNKRNNREATTSKHRKNPGTKHGPGRSASPSTQGEELSTPEEPEKTLLQVCPIVPVITTYVVPGLIKDLYHDGTQYYSTPFGDDVPKDTHGCVECGPGWVKISSDPSKNRAKFVPIPAAAEVFIDGYYRRDQYGLDIFFPPTSFLVAEPFYRVLCKQLPAAIIDESLLKACLALSLKNLVPLKYGETTSEFYISVIHRRTSTLMGKTGFAEKVTNNGSVVAYGDFGRINTTVALGVQVNTYAVLYVEDIECNHMEFPVRGDIEVLQDPHNLVDEVTKRLMFNVPDVEARRRGISKFFSYRGLDQPGFVEYSDSANNMNQGLKRLFGAREGEDNYRLNAAKLGRRIVDRNALSDSPFEECSRTQKMFNLLLNRRFHPNQLYADDGFENTRDFIAENLLDLVKKCNRTSVQSFLDYTNTSSSWAYYQIYSGILTTFQPLLSREAAAEIPHVKRALRRLYVNGRRLHTDDDIMVKEMKACVKRELAKYGKAPRLFVQYGAGAMYANELPEFIKTCIDGLHVYHCNGHTMAVYLMSKPRDAVMDSLFAELKAAMSSPKYAYVIIFSDDSCISGADSNGQSFGLNVDISSNDSSQDIPAFLALYMGMANFHPDRARGLIEQCMLPMRLSNPQNPAESVLVQFKGPIEGSGTCLTSNLNFLANFQNYLAAFHLWSNGMPIREAIVQGAALIGHQVTIEEWGIYGTELHRAQFLKRSPVLIDGRWVTQINLGCILRSMGSVDDELVARQLGWSQSQFVASTMTQRMQTFFSAVVGGWVHESGNSILNALRERFCSSYTEVIEHDSISQVFGETIQRTGSSDTGLFLRYGLSQGEIDEAVTLIRNTQLGMHMACSAFSKIYHVDYGIPLPLGMSLQ
jgi:hypothetical protein